MAQRSPAFPNRSPTRSALHPLRTSLATMLLTGLVWVSVSSAGLAQSTASELGLPLVENFPLEDYDAQPLLYGVNEGPDQVMYFSNFGSVVTYDGQTWNRIKVSDTPILRVTPDEDGSMLVSPMGDFGRLQRTPDRGWQFESFADRLPSELLPLGPIWTIVIEDGDIWFTLPRRVVRLNGGDPSDATIWNRPNGQQPVLTRQQGRLHVFEVGQGLFALGPDDEWQAIYPESDLWRNPAIRTISTFPNGDLAVAQSDGLVFRIDSDGDEHPWLAEPPAALGGSSLRMMICLKDGGILIGTTTAGALIFNAERELVHHLHDQNGLESNAISTLTVDHEGGVWMTHPRGATRIEINPNVTMFGPSSGLGKANIYGMDRTAEHVYAAAMSGVFRLDRATADSPARWHRFEIGALNPRTLITIKERVFVGRQTRIETITDGAFELLAEAPVSVSILAFMTDDLLFAGTDVGFLVYRLEPDLSLTEVYRDLSLETPVSSVTVEDATHWWISTVTRGNLRITLTDTPGFTRKPVLRSYGTADGLPFDGGQGSILNMRGQVIAFAEGRLYDYDPTSNLFRPNTSLAVPDRPLARINSFGASRGGIALGEFVFQDSPEQEQIGWFSNDANGDYHWHGLPARFSRLLGRGSATCLALSDKYDERVLWATGAGGVLRINLAQDTPSPAPPIVRFSEVAQDGRDWIADTQDRRYAYSRTPLRFMFSAPVYHRGAFTRYQYRMIGYDAEWTAPNPRPEATYTNLNGGDYAFEVRALDQRGDPGPVTRFAFSITPPFYRSSLAITVYVVAGFLAIIGLFRWRLSVATRERRRLEKLVAHRTAELGVAKDAAESANRAKSAFLANMSHELRTPLNGVLGYAQIMLRDRNLPAPNREQAKIVASSGEHLLKMINEVLDFSKIEAGKTELHPAPFRLPDLLRDIEAAIAPRAAAKALTLRITHDAGLPEQCIGDAQKLRQVIDNLLSNAIKFTAQGRVTLDVSRTSLAGAPRLGFAVTDTGTGLSAQDQAELFTPFHQASDGRPPEPGTGLGLSICRRLVQLMGGDITVESTLGQGSRFAFEIPLEEIASVESEQHADDRAMIVGYSGPRRRVLVVDDVEVNRALLQDLLQPIGFEVTSVPDGESALIWLQHNQPDAVVLDLRMPGIDGLELTRRIRASGAPQPRVILTSASVLSFDPQIAFDAGCDDFLPKPFRQQDLLNRLGRSLRIAWNYAAIASNEDAQLDPSEPSLHLHELQIASVRGDIKRVRSALAGLRKTHGLPTDILKEFDGYAVAYQMDRLRSRLKELLHIDDEA